jgi:hypothetical protein
MPISNVASFLATIKPDTSIRLDSLIVRPAVMPAGVARGPYVSGKPTPRPTLSSDFRARSRMFSGYGEDESAVSGTASVAIPGIVLIGLAFGGIYFLSRMAKRS